jgi:beta-galactosidase
MNKILINCVFMVFTATCSFAIPFDRQDRDFTMSLNSQWKFCLTENTQTQLLSEFFKTDFNDDKWNRISVPSNWEMQGYEEPHYYRPDPLRIGLYRKNVTLPKTWKDRQVIVHFEGISFGYTLYVNGEKAGSFQHAFLPCQFDITPYIRYDEKNTIAIKVYRDHDECQFDCNDDWALSGIYRDVFLFSPQRYHIDRYSLNTKLNRTEKTAVIEGQIEIRLFRHDPNSQHLDHRELLKPMVIKLVLKDADGNVQADQTETVSWITPRVVPSHTFKIPVTNAHYWNAEQPYLYDLSITLLTDGQISHVVKQKVGLREVTIEDGILKVNGQRIKLRGVCRHELYPEVGRALQEQHWLNDIKLMKAGNINAVRCSHYPPHPRFLELCDEYGLYVLDEVPIGFGESLQNDPVMLGAMLSRAQRTVERDRNHPCVIIWDIGNENPLYGLQETAAQYVKKMDPTRPLLYPGENFVGLNKSFASGSAEFVDIIAPHYPHNEELQRDLEDNTIQKPILFTEISHALDTAFSDFETKWQMIESTDKIAGAMIWLWADQGIIRKVNGREVVDSYADISLVRGRHTVLSGDVWLDDNTILDSHGPDGTDGIVYADRRLQTDYYETRKVYSPIHISQKYIKLDAEGKIYLDIENRHDFTNLNQFEGHWKFLINGHTFKEGRLSLDCPPHESKTAEIPIGLLKLPVSDLMLRIEFVNKNQISIYERTLIFENSQVDWFAKMDKAPEGVFAKGSRIQVNDDGIFTIGDTKQAILMKGPFARIGRKPTMAERMTYPRMDLTIWEPPILTDFEVTQRKEKKQDDGLIVQTKVKYKNPKNTGQTVHADITYTISPSGWVDIEYTIAPAGENGALLELGLAWEIPNAKKINWLGDGPYCSYPYKSELAERGIYSITPKDPFFNGNRMNVELVNLVYSNKQLGVIAEASNIGWEQDPIADRIIFYQNQKLASLGTKFELPRQVIRSKDIGNTKGHLRFCVLSDDKAGFIQEIFE